MSTTSMIFLQEGQVVKVKLLAIKDGKLDLSIKKALPATSGPPSVLSSPALPLRAPPPAAYCGPPPALRTGAGRQYRPFRRRMAFEDKLKQFLSSSERKMADLNRNISGKQGGRRRR